MSECSVCAGTGKPVSGLPCICGGTGRQSDEMHGLRLQIQQLQYTNAELVEYKQNYHKVMQLLKRTKMKHGLCKPRIRRACTHCNAIDDIEIMLADYKGPEIVLAKHKESE